MFNTGTAGDFRIGDGTQGLKIGVATGGGGAGDVRVFAFGGTSRLILGSSTNDGLLTVVSNIVGINTLTPAADTSLDVEGTNYDCIYTLNAAFEGNGIESLATAYNGWGVFGESSGEVGVGVVGSGDGSGNQATVGVYGRYF